MLTLNILYRNKNTGKEYIRFEVKPNERKIDLFDVVDDSACSDITVTIEELERDFEEIDRYEEED